jgi:hypothetical protein
MTLLGSCRYALFAGLVFSMLAACNAGGYQVAPSASNGLRSTSSRAFSSVRPTMLSGEVLKTTNGGSYVCFHESHGYNKVIFSTHGHASGPYPGSFTAHGAWYWGGLYHVQGFNERFTIRSGTLAISGKFPPDGLVRSKQSCRHFGSFALRYDAGSWGSGPAAAHIFVHGSFLEKLR